MNELQMRIGLEIYHGSECMRLNHEIKISRMLTLEQAAKILTRFSELAKEVQQAQLPQEGRR